MCDDIFEDSDSEQMIIDNNWKKEIGFVRKEGYREGVSAAEEDCVQQGFNEAFAVSCPLLYRAALLRGTISALLSSAILKKRTLDDSEKTALTEFLGDVTALEMQLLNYNEKRLDVLRLDTAEQSGSNSSTFRGLQTGQCCNKGRCSNTSNRSDATGDRPVEDDSVFVVDKTGNVLETEEGQGNSDSVSHGAYDKSGKELADSVDKDTRTDQESETNTIVTAGTSHNEQLYGIQERLNVLKKEYKTLLQLVS